LIQTYTHALTLVDYGVASVTAAGEQESGDRHLVKTIPGGTLFAVVDGSGHGRNAAIPAQLAISVLETHALESATSLMSRCHEKLQATRGAVLSIGAIDGVENTLTWLGVGNVEGVLLRYGSSNAPESQTMRLWPGIVGYRLPPLEPQVTSIAPGDLVIMTTDGIQPDFGRQFGSNESTRRIAEHISLNRRRGLDDGLVLVVRYLGSSE